MGHIIDAADAANRYPELLQIADSVVMNASFIAQAEAYVEGNLYSQYTTPFSYNNMTAVDLTIDVVYCKMMRNKQPKLAAEVQKTVDARIGAIQKGTLRMMTTSGDAVGATAGAVSWSNTDGYAPPTGLGNQLDFVVSSQQQYDEEQERLYGVNP